MALSVVNSINNIAASAHTVTTAGLNITAGNLIVVGTLNFNADALNDDVSVTDSVGNTYTKIGSCALVNSLHCSLWYAKNVIGGASVTFTYNVTSNQVDFPRIYVMQVAGADTTTPLDQSGFANSGGTSGTVLTSPSLTTTLANEILIAISGDGSTSATTTFSDGGAATGGWTTDTSTSDTTTLEGAFGHAIVSTTGSYAATSTISVANGSRMIGLATFKAAASGIPPGLGPVVPNLCFEMPPGAIWV